MASGIMSGVSSKVEHAQLIQLNRIRTEVGDLVACEKEGGIPFDPVRVYYLYDVPDTAERGGHAHRELQQVIVAVSGSFKVVLSDGTEEKVVVLRKPTEGLLLPPGLWRTLEDFSGGAICLVLASHEYDEGDYIRDFNDFKLWKELGCG